MDSPNLKIIKQLWDRFEHEGLAASVEEMIPYCSEDVVFRPHAAGERELRGVGELRDFWSDLVASGTRVEASAYEFHERQDTVIVTGWLRIARDAGALADAQRRWVFTFENGKITSATAGPLHGSERPPSKPADG